MGYGPAGRVVERLDEEESQRGAALLDGARRQFAISKQMRLVLADVLRP